MTHDKTHPAKVIDSATGTAMVGHEWDGIEELDTPLPRWWLWTFYATIAFSLVYVVLYPAIPMLHSASTGTLGWTSRGVLADDIAHEKVEHQAIRNAIAATPIEALAANPALQRAAIEGGHAAFKVNCVQCHGSGAAGGKGYPNLNDDDWLWGGDLSAIQQTLVNGIRQPGNDATRSSLMPSFGKDGILTGAQVQDVVSHVRVLSQQDPANASSARGAQLYADNCAVCHGANGEGNRGVGAPKLSDKIWLYGGDRASLVNTVTNAHAGVMPAWTGRLDPVTIKMLAVYVHSLGGGEAAPALAAPAAPAAGAAQ
ncbi:cytochrome-c oxidase, cbb3-type subunit III [Novosphingobium sp.]|uniref:cytochrome-c oxidase, cbb3-type subunit III n=1 Tax=Novosphingobium sp. TaxID=1874826 RepID=UPI001E0E80BD|nr:cytochrome-c oxidase, cbb3-type subunit III [Novosphingobium sp.]MBX9664723.1 cytochrome-c oxidase, cbb3-type subunit III [Novosphingobium sp.]